MIVVDVETGGIDPKVNSLLSIGAVDFNNPQNTFYGECDMRKGTVITDEALLINGMSIEYIEQQQAPPILMNEFIRWCDRVESNILAGHNPSFDLGFIRENCDVYNLKCPFGYRTVDLHSLAYGHMLKNNLFRAKLTSNDVYDMLGMIKEPDPHNGLTGAKMECEAFHRLIYGKGVYNGYDNNS